MNGGIPHLDRPSGNRWRIVGWTGAAALLLLPLVAMQFTDEVNWNETDFLAFGAMLMVAGAGIELAARMSGSAVLHTALIAAVVVGFLLVWAQLAVGIVGGG